MCNGMEMDAEAANEALGAFKRMDEVLGVIFFENEKKEVEVPAEVQSLLDQRAEARKAKNWAESDRLRVRASRRRVESPESGVRSQYLGVGGQESVLRS